MHSQSTARTVSQLSLRGKHVALPRPDILLIDVHSAFANSKPRFALLQAGTTSDFQFDITLACSPRPDCSGRAELMIPAPATVPCAPSEASLSASRCFEAACSAVPCAFRCPHRSNLGPGRAPRSRAETVGFGGFNNKSTTSQRVPKAPSEKCCVTVFRRREWRGGGCSRCALSRLVARLRKFGATVALIADAADGPNAAEGSCTNNDPRVPEHMPMPLVCV